MSAAPQLNHRPVVAWLALLTVWIVWGSTYLAIREAVDTIPPLLMAGVRFLTAGLVMFAFVGPRHARGAGRPTARQLRSVLIVAVLLLVGGNGLLSVGETRLDSAAAALIVATVPVWMVLINAAVTRTRVTGTMVLTLSLGTVGVAVLIGGPGARVDVLSAGVVLFASVCWAAGSVCSRRLPLPSHPLVVTSLEMLAGGLVLIIAAAATGEFARLDFAAITTRSIVGLLWLIVAGSMIAFTAYVYAIAHLPTDTVATYAYVNPMVAVALGTLLADEVLTANLVLGGTVIIAAVVLNVSKAITRTPRPVLPAPAEEKSAR
ncbi:drug/metabolite transporter (DMT)-like permease [Actinomadura pelletieri DSM 43383]|uniref:Drug/metabolite transporter (DMT)-like permease n=1 Tax=Actinomadura pelletieri DSM 43383 TaxID=1120940 RepID=A0A495QMA0_9ACTN|nr:drug/metabolite transporter (DMT)-like permease [Actinomadura pelletieri DSM 43383]